MPTTQAPKRRLESMAVALLSLAVTTAAAVLPTLAHADIYVTANGEVDRYDNSGALLQGALITTGNGGIAVTDSNIYVITNWNNNYGNPTGKIGKYTLTGATINDSLISGYDMNGLTVSGNNIYVDNYFGGTVGQYTTTGVTVNASLINVGQYSYPRGITVVGSNLFVGLYAGGDYSGGPHAVNKYTTSGTMLRSSLVSVPNSAIGGVAVAGANLFITLPWLGRVDEYTTSGTLVKQGLITGLDNPQHIAVCGSNLLVANGPGSGVVGEYSMSGSTVNAALITSPNGIGGMAVTGNAAPPANDPNVSWIVSSGYFEDASSWQDGNGNQRMPGATDNLLFALPGSSSVSTLSPHSVQSIAVSNGTTRLNLFGGPLTASSNVTVTAPGLLYVSYGSLSTASLSNSGTMRVQSSGSLTVNGSAANNAGGTLTVSSTTASVNVSGDLSNAGTITHSSGTLTVAGNLDVHGTYTCTGGTASVGSLSNAGTMNLSGTGAFKVNGNATNAAGGTINVAAGLTATGSFTNSGTITQTATAMTAGSLSNSGAWTVSQGTLTVNGNATNSGTMNVTGTMTVNGTLTNSGTLTPLGSITTQTFSQTAGGTWNIQLGSAGTGEILSGQAALGGNLNITLTGGFQPTEGSTYQILASNSLTGLLNNGSPYVKAGSNVYKINYATTGVTLQSITTADIASRTYTPTVWATDATSTLSHLARWDASAQSWVQLTAADANSINSGHVRVLVHGWGDGESDYVAANGGAAARVWADANGAANDWYAPFTGLAANLAQASPGDTILAYSWIDHSATISSIAAGIAKQSERQTDGAGKEMKDALENAGINANFSANGGQIQLIGHSHGARVSTVAATSLQNDGVAINQLTLLDSPENIPVVGLIMDQRYKGAFNHLDNYLTKLSSSTFVDNYYSCFGIPYHNDSVNVDLENALNHGYPISWYGAASVNTADEGVHWSPLNGDLSTTLARQYYRDMATDRLSTDPAVNDRGNGASRAHQVSLPTGNSDGLVAFGGNATTLTEGSPAYWDTTLTLAAGDSAFSFDYQFIRMGDGDQLGVWIDDNLEFIIQGTLAGTSLQSATIDLSDLSPGVHDLTFALYSVGSSAGDADASFSVSDFSVSNDVPEPASLAILALGLTSLCLRRKLR